MKLLCLDEDNCGHVEYYPNNETRPFICAACYGAALPFTNDYIPGKSLEFTLEPIVLQENNKENLKEED